MAGDMAVMVFLPTVPCVVLAMHFREKAEVGSLIPFFPGSNDLVRKG